MSYWLYYQIGVHDEWSFECFGSKELALAKFNEITIHRTAEEQQKLVLPLLIEGRIIEMIPVSVATRYVEKE